MRELFDLAMSQPPEDRAAFVQRVADDPAIAAEVLAMLHGAAAATASLRAPIDGPPYVATARPGGELEFSRPAVLSVHATASGELMQRLVEAPRLDEGRFALGEQVGEGGMGAVYRVQDRLLNRQLALKVLLEQAPLAAHLGGGMPSSRVGRFLEEAQVTSQLDHPGVVPVHDLGIDQRGKVYFTMRLVNGRTASQVFADAFGSRNGWDPTKAIEVLLKVCDTMSYAHEKGVIHRDLKPSNVMVGRFGEVYVMDWGLAKVAGHQDRHRSPEERPNSANVGQLDTARRRDAEMDCAAPWLTVEGDRLGTPCYMPPEQARGDFTSLDARADVYAIGAMLYELLAGHAPYAEGNDRPSPKQVRQAVADGPPKALDATSPRVPAELVAIVGKAMAHSREYRYESTAALADDLRAFLGSQVVSAYRTGALVELRMWIRRNRPLASSLAAAIAILAIGVVLTSLLANQNRILAASESSAKLAAERTVGNFQRLAGVVRLRETMARQAALWPAWPDQIAPLEAWIHDDCLPLLAMRDQVASTLHDVSRPPAVAADRATAPTIGSGRDSDTAAAQFLQGAMTELLAGLTRLEQIELPDIERRLAWAKGLAEATQHHPQARYSWQQVRAALAKADGTVASARYAGKDLHIPEEGLMGLVPIGMNPITKLWEFYDLRSAWDGVVPATAIDIPVHRDDGTIPVSATLGIVYVLVPEATFRMGAQPDPAHANFDPEAERDEHFVHDEHVSAFLIARHEMTQAQWLRIVGDNPSEFREGSRFADEPITPMNPVERVSWEDATAALRRLGARLPTSAEWEMAARAGTTTPWWFGDDPAQLPRFANVADARFRPHGPERWDYSPWPDDSYCHTAVDRRPANAFGLHEVHGNVREWCQDLWRGAYGREPIVGERQRQLRGSSWATGWKFSRSADRDADDPARRSREIGVRAARSLPPR